MLLGELSQFKWIKLTNDWGLVNYKQVGCGKIR